MGIIGWGPYCQYNAYPGSIKSGVQKIEKHSCRPVCTYVAIFEACACNRLRQAYQ